MIYIKRKISKGQTPKDRLEWKQASEYWTKESPVASNANLSNIDYYEKIASEYDVILRFTEEVQ